MKTKLLLICLFFSFANIASAVSISPKIIEYLKSTGQIESIVNADRAARANGVWAPNQYPYRPNVATDVDTLHCLIILVDFDDMPHENGFHSEPPDFDTLLFSENFTQTGSMTDYYMENSYGQALLLGQVTDWYRMPELYSYYVNGQRGFGSYPRNAQRLTEDAIAAADPDVDFSQYDNNGDGRVDALFVIHAGPGYEDTGNLNYIHSHAWVISHQTEMDGVIIYGYSMEPEETGSGNLVTIGVFCHEFGHVLGVPDLYDYDYDSDGTGMWSLMSGGSWGGGGAVPVQLDAWSKIQLGFIAPVILSDNLVNQQIDAVEYNPQVYQLFDQGSYDSQYFLVENRQRRLFDVSLPGSGLLIYHVDETQPNNDDQTHYKVAVEQADGRFNLEHAQGSDNGDPWPGSTNNRVFNDQSVPNSYFYFDVPSQVSITAISDSDSSMFADLSIMYLDPYYEILGISINDSTGNNNGRPDAGETCRMLFTAQNSRAQVDDLVVTVSSDDPNIAFGDSVSNFGFMPINEPFNNSTDPIAFSVAQNYTARFATFYFDFSARNGTYNQRISRRLLVGNPEIILVDDDAGTAIDTFYTTMLDSLGNTYEVWNVSTQGSPSSTLLSYSSVIWETGDARSNAISPENVSAITAYLSNGGRILISSQDFVQNLSERAQPADLTLLNDYLKVTYSMREINAAVNGDSGTIFEEHSYITAGNGGAGNQSSRDALLVQQGGIEIMKYLSGRTAAVGVINGYVALTVGFGAESINNRANTFDHRDDFLHTALLFLATPTSISDPNATLPSKSLIAENYPNPFNSSANIKFVLNRNAEVSFKIFNIAGQIVADLSGNYHTGENIVNWDASKFTSGVYFYNIRTDEASIAKKMILIK